MQTEYAHAFLNTAPDAILLMLVVSTAFISLALIVSRVPRKHKVKG